MRLVQLFENTGIYLEDALKRREISGVSYNTKTLNPGEIFVCIKGYSQDGHIFAEDAVKKGAAVILAESDVPVTGVPVIKSADTRRTLSQISANYFGRPSEKMEIIGVTGTNGKTSITYMLRRIMEQAGKSCGIIGTIAYEYAGKKENAANTTPESYEIHRFLRQMREAGITCCAMEVSSHALALKRIADVSIDYGIFTNLTPDHLDFHKTLEEYYNAKKMLFQMIKKDGVINIDDPYGKRLSDELRADGKVYCSCSLKDKNADYYADIISMDETGSSIGMFASGEKIGEMQTSIPGIFSVYNVLMAAAVSMLAGIRFSDIAEAVFGLSGVPGRFETVKNDRGITAIVDYAHTPDALENILKTVNSFKKGRLICVFGCGGNRDTSKRPLMGKAAGTYADYCIITSDNPRMEAPMDIIAGVEEGIYDTGCNYEIIENRYEAIKKAVGMFNKNDVIVVAGKGHEDYQIIGTEKIHFDDREALFELISKL